MKVLFLSVLIGLFIQPESPVKWHISAPKSAKVGDVIEIKFAGTIKKDWYVYASDNTVEGPMPSSLKIEEINGLSKDGKLISVHPKEKYDEVWEGKIRIFEKKALLTQKIKLTQSTTNIKGVLEGQACSNVNGTCVPFKQAFELVIKM